jgi:hypothetical protein
MLPIKGMNPALTAIITLLTERVYYLVTLTNYN